MTRKPILMTKDQMIHVLEGLALRRREIERFNPNMKVEAIDNIIDLEQQIADVLSGVPVIY